MSDNKVVFWDIANTDYDTPYVGGYYYRSDIIDFVKRLKEDNKQVVGIAVDNSYNIEFITKEITNDTE